jgi:uncharacterized protein (DUF302 family)
MKYYINTVLQTSFSDAVEKATESLKSEGFGVISEIDISEKLKEKLGVDFRKYKILGACNPPAAYEALKQEDKIGTMLPCNVIIQELADGKIEIAAIDPVASMQAVESKNLGGIAENIRKHLQDAIAKLN